MGRKKSVELYEEILGDGYDAITTSYYLQECLHGQVSEVIDRFDAYLKTSPDELDLVEMKDKLFKFNKKVLNLRREFEKAGWNYGSKPDKESIQVRYLYYRQELIYMALAAKNEISQIEKNMALDRMDSEGDWDDE